MGVTLKLPYFVKNHASRYFSSKNGCFFDFGVKKHERGYNRGVTRFFLILGGLVLTAGPLFCLLWTLLPPMRYGLWITGLLASEWALWLGIFALVGAGLGGMAFRMDARGAGGTIVLMGVAAAALSLIPYFQTLSVARANGTSLSWSRYFAQLPGREMGKPDMTEIFATPSGAPLALDVYLPPKTENTDARPAVIVVHGGSWNAGDKSDFPQWSRWLAQNGYVVFDVQYRLKPQPNFRTATGDVKAAVLWVKRSARKFNVNANRVALLGRSAGGQLALLAAYAPNDARLPPSGSLHGDASVKAVVSFYGPADLRWGYANPARFDIIHGPETLRRYLGGSPETAGAIYDLTAPAARVGPHTPPTLLFHGDRDTVVGPVHTHHLAARLDTAHIPRQAVFFPYATHGFDYNFDGWASQVVQKVLLDFLKKHLA